MTPYEHAPISYNGSEIEVKATTATGVRETEGGTVQLTSLQFYLNSVLKIVLNVAPEEIAASYAAGVAALKDEIDGVGEADKILLELMFTEAAGMDQVDTPTGFTASQPDGPGGDVMLTWDVVGPVEVYQIEQASASDYSGAFTIAAYDLSPFALAGYAPGTYYFRIRAKISGLTDSEWANASINVA